MTSDDVADGSTGKGDLNHRSPGRQHSALGQRLRGPQGVLGPSVLWLFPWS